MGRPPQPLEFGNPLLAKINERTTLLTLNLLQKPATQIPEALLLPYLRRRLSRGIKHEDGVEFVVKLVRELRNQWDRFAPNVRKRFIENLFGHMMLLSKEKHEHGIEILGDIPILMVISPTMRCNLQCTGCYSANYDREDAIDTPTFHRILREAKELGIYFVVVSGGEPFIRSDLLEIFETHSDMIFLTYTNGTFIYRDKLAPKLAELGNVIPCISVEGFSEETDRRRGKGTFTKIIGAMSALREAGGHVRVLRHTDARKQRTSRVRRIHRVLLQPGVFHRLVFQLHARGPGPRPFAHAHAGAA